jgi:hypothetical protein
MLDGGLMKAPQAPPSEYRVLNLAPRTPLEKIGDVAKPWEESSLTQIYRELHDDVKDRYMEQRIEIAEIGRLTANARSGKLLMKRDPMSGALALIKPLPQKPRVDRHVYPLAQVNSSQLTSIWTLSRPTIIPRAFGTNNKAQIEHAIIGKVIEHYLAECDELFHQQQSLSMMDYGTSVVRVYYDDKLNAIHQLQPIIENTSKTVYSGYAYCDNCPKDGEPQDFASQYGGMPQCPDCGSFNVQSMHQPQVVTAPSIVGVQPMSQGDIGIELLAVPAVNWDQRKMVQQSSYKSYRSEVPQRLVSSILGRDIAEDNPDSDPLLRVVNALGNRGGSVEGYGRDRVYSHTDGSDRGVSLMDEEWFDPEWYAGRKLPKDEITVSGQTIPADTPLEQIFPDGLAVMSFNDGLTPVYMCNEKCHLYSGVYHIQSHSGVGKGTSDSIEISEQLNIAHTANLNMLKRMGAGGGYAYDREVMTQKEAKALLNPANLVGVKLRGTAYTSVDQAIKQFQHNPASGDSLTMVAQLANLMNICFQTTEFTDGVANNRVDVNTATGQQMLQAQNQQRSVAPLRMKGYMFARIVEGVLNIFRDKMLMPVCFGTNDKFALSKAKFISGSDIPPNIKCDFVPDSEAPQNVDTQKRSAMEMAESALNIAPGVGFLGLMQAKPRLAAWFASMFPGVDIPEFDQTEMLMICQGWIDSLKQTTEDISSRQQISGYFAPPEEAAQEAIQSLNIDPNAENPAIKAEILREYLDDDEVKTWSPTMRASIDALIQQLYIWDRDDRFRIPTLDQQGQLALQGNATAATAQQQAPIMAAQANMQQQQQGQQQDAEAQNEVLSRLGDEAQKTIEFSRDQEGKDADHERKLKEIKAQNEGRKQPITRNTRAAGGNR